jgi:hypothetical protein
MALNKTKTAASAAPATTVGAETGVKKASNFNSQKDEMEKKALESYNAIPEEQRAAFGRDRATLTFVNTLGLQSRKRPRMTGNNTPVDSFETVGLKLKSDKPIEIPQIDVKYTQITGIPEGGIGSRSVAAGETFTVTLIEFMYLIVREEYSGACNDGRGNIDGLTLAVKLNKMFSAEAKLPTPTLNFKAGGSPKENQEAIDISAGEGKWEIKDEYKEKFGALLERKAPVRAAGGAKKDSDRQAVVANMLRGMLFNQPQ